MADRLTSMTVAQDDGLSACAGLIQNDTQDGRDTIPTESCLNCFL